MCRWPTSLHASQPDRPRVLLHCDERGAGDPIVVLHGLFGSGANWRSFARSISDTHRVVLVDLRNHGRSFHDAKTGYPTLASDVAEVCRARRLASPTILGHSMGGKVAMYLALTRSSLVGRLVVIDIAPRPYDADDRGLIDGLLDVDVARAVSRSEVERKLERFVDDADLRAFFSMNLAPVQGGGFRWKFNLPALAESYDQLRGWPSLEGRYSGPTLLVRGSRSGYVADGDVERMRSHFPRLRVVDVAGAGHWVHVEALAPLLDAVRAFASV